MGVNDIGELDAGICDLLEASEDPDGNASAYVSIL